MTVALTNKNLSRLNNETETIGIHSNNEYYNPDLVTHQTYEDYLAAQGLDQLEDIIANNKSTSEAKNIWQNFANLVTAAKASDSFFFINALGHAILKFKAAVNAENIIGKFEDLFKDSKLPIFLVATIIRINEEKKKKEAIKQKKEKPLKIKIVSNNNVATGKLEAESPKDVLAPDLARPYQTGIDGAIKGFLNIPLVNDTASLLIIGGFLEPRLRDARFNVYYDHLIKHFLTLKKGEIRDKKYFDDRENCVAISEETLNRLIQCIKDYIATAGRLTHPSNMSILPKAMTETYRALLIAFLTINFESYKGSETVTWTLYCDDGTSYKVHIPKPALGHFLSFLNIRQLEEMLKISNQDFKKSIEKDSKKALLQRSITDECLETSLNNLFYDPNFAVLQPLLLLKSSLPDEYHNFFDKNLFDSATIDFEQHIKAVFHDFLRNKLPITDDDKELSYELETLLKNLCGKNPKQELKAFKSLIDQKMNALLNKEVAGKIREQIADKDFQAFLDELPSINSLSSGDIGLIITSIVQGKFQDLKKLKNKNLGNLLFVVLTKSKLAQLALIALPACYHFLATVATAAVPNSAIGWLVKNRIKKKTKLSADTLNQLPQQIKGLALEPDENLVPKLKQLLGPGAGTNKLSKEGQKWIKEAFDFASSSLYCLQLKKLIATPISSTTPLDFVEKTFNTSPFFQNKLRETTIKWKNFIADLTRLREDDNFIERFMKFSRKSPHTNLLQNIALHPEIYNKYEPLIFCVLLNNCKLSQIHTENIVYKDAFYLSAVFQDMTAAVAALFLNQLTEEVNPQFNEDISERLKSEAIKLGIFQKTIYYKAIYDEKGNLAFDAKGKLLCEKSETTYPEIEKVVCESLTFAGHKFSKNDPNFRFLIRHYSGEENKEVFEALPSVHQAQSENIPTVALNAEYLKKTKDILMQDFPKLAKQEKIGRLFILLSLAVKIKNNEYANEAVALALQHYNREFDRLVDEHFKKQPEGAVKEDELSSLIANGRSDFIEALLKKTTEFNLSILTAKGFNPILMANTALVKAQKQNKDLKDYMKILDTIIQHCADKNELFTLVITLKITIDINNNDSSLLYKDIVGKIIDALFKLDFNKTE